MSLTVIDPLTVFNAGKNGVFISRNFGMETTISGMKAKLR